MATANPAANMAVYERAGIASSSAGVMTLPGTVVKTAFLVTILLIAAVYTYTKTLAGDLQLSYGLMMGGALGGFIVAMITIFAPRVSPITAPIYAVLEGLLLGAISGVFENRYHGIATEAVGLTVGVLGMLLFVYGTRIIRVTENFKIGVVAATGAICLVYLATMLLGIFGIQVPYIHQSGPIGIGFSVVVVIIAAMNLILDFDFIEKGVEHRAPRYMEWYGGFSLLVTLIWMYLEILRLLSKLRGRD